MKKRTKPNGVELQQLIEDTTENWYWLTIAFVDACQLIGYSVA